MSRSIVMALLLVACSSPDVPERYGFVARLGEDTVSVERISRSRSRLVSDGVDRFPFVRRRHTELDLMDDGRIRRLVMDVRTPSGQTPAARARRITADFGSGTVRIVIRDSGGTRDTSFAIGTAIAVPHVSMMYSLIELEIAAALRRRESADSTGRIRFRQFYPDRDIGPSFALHQGFVQPVDSGRVVLRHDWLSGAGDAIVDSAGRLLSYSGARSTYKVNVERTTALPDVEAFGDRLAADERAAGARQLSVRDTTRATIGAATFAVDYGRPLLRGRTLLGDVIPYDLVWRTGANAATQFTTSAPITLAGLAVPAGSYTLWTVPRRDRIELVVNTQTGIWGTAYSRAHDLGRATLRADSTRDPVDRFTIEIVPGGPSRGTLSLAWGRFRWMAPIVVR